MRWERLKGSRWAAEKPASAREPQGSGHPQQCGVAADQDGALPRLGKGNVLSLSWWLEREVWDWPLVQEGQNWGARGQGSKEVCDS